MKDVAQFIKSQKELNELPFLIVFQTIQILREKGLLKEFENVDRIQP